MKLTAVEIDDIQISIHAPREGRDHAAVRIALHHHQISIHAPREGRDFAAICQCHK